MEGIGNIKPEIKKVAFEKQGYISVYLQDGRLVMAPLRLYPSIKKLKMAQRKHYQIADGDTLIFIDGNEVYHIQDFLGLYQDYKYSFV